MNTIIRGQIAENGVIYEQPTNENTSKYVTPAKLSPMKTKYSQKLDSFNSTVRSNQVLNVTGISREIN